MPVGCKQAKFAATRLDEAVTSMSRYGSVTQFAVSTSDTVSQKESNSQASGFSVIQQGPSERKLEKEGQHSDFGVTDLCGRVLSFEIN